MLPFSNIVRSNTALAAAAMNAKIPAAETAAAHKTVLTRSYQKFLLPLSD